MEPFKTRLTRFVDNDVLEIPDTLLNSIQGFLLPEIERAAGAQSWRLVHSGLHSVMQIVGEQIMGLQPVASTKFFLETFVDSTGEGFDFSTVSSEIHEMRNVMSHRWFGKIMHEIVADGNQAVGWRHKDGVLYLNDSLYHDAFQTGFRDRVWDFFWAKYNDEEALRIRKYEFLRSFLKLEKSSPIAAMIKSFPKTDLGSERDQLESDIQSAIHAEFL